MRRFVSIAKATALEILSEPLSLLLLSSALALSVFAPAFHYHQFGEPSRMARDAGISAMFLLGTVFAVCGTIRSFRRELESGTAASALAHPVSRGQFFLAKCCGAFVASLLFAVTVGAVTGLMVNGAEIGGALAEQTDGMARIWGPAYASGVAVIVVPYAFGAVMNRFFRFRFSLSAFLCAGVLALAALFACRFDARGFLRLLPAFALLEAPVAAFVVTAAAASVRLKVNAASAVVAAVAAAFLPFAGGYCLSEALAGGGTIPFAYVGAAVAALVPAVAAFGLVGISLMRGRDL